MDKLQQNATNRVLALPKHHWDGQTSQEASPQISADPEQP